VAVTTPLTADLGTYQGRIRPTNWTPIHGEYVFCLGHDLPGQTYSMPTGIMLSIGQTFDTTGFNVLQIKLHLRAPLSVPSGYTWICEVHTFGGPQCTFEITSADVYQERTVEVTVPAVAESIIELRVDLALTGPTSPVEVELPAIYLDAAISANSVMESMVTRQSPAPDSVDIWPSRVIEFQAYALDGSGLSTVEIYVNSELVATMSGAYAATASYVAPGWAVLAVALAFGDAITDYTVTPPGPWESESLIDVSAIVTTGSTIVRAHGWQFTIADTAGPRIISAVAPSIYEVSVEWNEPIADASLDASLFTLALESDPPAYVPNVLDVRRDPLAARPTRIALTLDQPATPGATYRVTASAGVTDALGNAVESQYAFATFDAYLSPLTPANRLLSLYQELPAAERATDQFGELKLFCDVLDEGLRALAVVADDWPLVAVDPDTAIEPWLDAILWELGNPFEWLPMDIRTKRLLARWMHALVALKGSGLGIRAAIRLLLGIETQVHVYGVGLALLGDTVLGETFVLGTDDEDDLYTFWVIVDAQLDVETRGYMNRIIDIMKVANERHLIIEPDTVFVPDHWALGFSDLGTETELHV
jgi:phage tail-like protein